MIVLATKLIYVSGKSSAIYSTYALHAVVHFFETKDFLSGWQVYYIGYPMNDVKLMKCVPFIRL